jgi:hypothetical protein
VSLLYQLSWPQRIAAPYHAAWQSMTEAVYTGKLLRSAHVTRIRAGIPEGLEGFAAADAGHNVTEGLSRVRYLVFSDSLSVKFDSPSSGAF